MEYSKRKSKGHVYNEIIGILNHLPNYCYIANESSWLVYWLNDVYMYSWWLFDFKSFSDTNEWEICAHGHRDENTTVSHLTLRNCSWGVYIDTRIWLPSLCSWVPMVIIVVPYAHLSTHPCPTRSYICWGNLMSGHVNQANNSEQFAINRPSVYPEWSCRSVQTFYIWAWNIVQRLTIPWNFMD